MSPKQRRAVAIPSSEAPFLRDRERAESQDASEALIALVPSGPFLFCSQRTNSAAARNWLRPDAPSTLRASRRADRGTCRSSRCRRIPHTSEDAAATLLSSGNLRRHSLGALNQDLFRAELSSWLKASLGKIVGHVVTNLKRQMVVALSPL